MFGVGKKLGGERRRKSSVLTHVARACGISYQKFTGSVELLVMYSSYTLAYPWQRSVGPDRRHCDFALTDDGMRLSARATKGEKGTACPLRCEGEGGKKSGKTKQNKNEERKKSKSVRLPPSNQKLSSLPLLY